MAADKELFRPELVFFDWDVANTDELFQKLEKELLGGGVHQ